jgi:uncharacterized membrane protein
MLVRTRLSLAVALLVTLLIALTAVAVGCLWSLHLSGVAITAALAGVGAIGAVLFAYAVARELPDDSEGLVIEPQPLTTPSLRPPEPAPVSLKEAPIAHLPPEYLAAIMKGVQARHAAYRTEAREARARLS